MSRTQLFWFLQAFGWLGWLVVFGLRDVFTQPNMGGFGYLVLDAGAGFFLTTCLRWLYRKTWQNSLSTRLSSLILGSALGAMIWQPIKNYPQIAYLNEVQALYDFGFSAYFAGVLGYSFIVLLGWSFLYFGLKLYLQLEEERRSRTLAEAMAVESQLQMLRYQVNPHFLFNTLNAISTLILIRDTDRAHSVLQRLSEFLRYTLQTEGEALVPLASEIGAIRSYLAIESVRFEGRIKIDIIVPENLPSCQVPSLILQPLVENAIKHGIAKSQEKGRLEILVEVADQLLKLKVKDSGPGFDSNDIVHGVGLSNIERRLALHYPDQWAFEVKNHGGIGAEVTISLPISPQEVKVLDQGALS